MNKSSLAVIGYTKGKQIAVYLATNEKSRSRESLNSTSSRVQHYSVVLTEIGKERKKTTMEVYYHYTRSESPLVNYKEPNRLESNLNGH